MNGKTAVNIDAYIAEAAEAARPLLATLRATIVAAAPMAEETISYQMPAYKYHGILVYFAAHKKHIGFYPTGSAIAAFEAELTGYKTSKGTLQFPLDQPLPVDLITRIVLHRVAENQSKSKKRKS